MTTKSKRANRDLGGALIDIAMIEKGVSTAELARLSGVSRILLTNYLNGSVEPSISQIMRVLEPLGLEVRMRVDVRDDHDENLASYEASLPGETRTAAEILASYDEGRRVARERVRVSPESEE